MITDKIDAITRIPETHRFAKIPAPRSVKIEGSPRCNYRCGFCALRTRECQPREDMDYPLFQRITEEMRAAGVEEIGVFYLGESFMAPHLLTDCIRWCKQELGFPYVFLTTNGSLMTPMQAGELMAEGLDSLKFSINAPHDQFKDAMGVKPKLLDTALRNLESACELLVVLILSMFSPSRKKLGTMASADPCGLNLASLSDLL